MKEAVDASTHPVVFSGPYQFLDYFREEDQQKFGGRERDIREIVARITKDRTFVLYGRSGLGKTSLLLAGVFPELRRREFHPIYIRTLTSPTSDLHRAVALEFPEPVSRPEKLQELIFEFSEQPLVLVLDQFEEFFIRFKDKSKERIEFIQTIADLVSDDRLALRIVFSLREDFVAELDDFFGDLPNLLENAFRLLPLTAYGARQAVSQPLIKSGVSYDQRFLVDLVDTLAAIEFDPTLLQIVCSEVYRQAATRNQGPLQLTREDLENIGGLEGIFRRYLDGAIQNIPQEDHLLTRVILDALITQERTKRAVNLAFFFEFDFIATQEEIQEVLQLLVHHRLVRSEQRGQELWYELIHERLVDTILKWMELDREFYNYRVAKHLVVNMSHGEIWRENPEALLNKGQLEGVVGPFKERLRLDDIQKEFLLTSAIYRRSEHVEYWAKAYDFTRSAGLTLAMLSSDSPAIREGAAKSARQLPDVDGRLAGACLKVALEDDNREVQRAAGYSFAVLASEPQLKRLRGALKDKTTRRNALEVLADLYEADR